MQDSDDDDFNQIISLLAGGPNDPPEGAERQQKRAKGIWIKVVKSNNEKVREVSDNSSDNSGEHSDSVKYLYVARPTILRTDIRRSYCSMLVNTMNSMEFPLLFGFLDTYCTPATKQCAVAFNPVTFHPQSIIIHGVESMAKYWFSTMQISPDAVTTLTETKIHLISGTNKSKIVSKFKFSATKMYDLPNIQQRVFIDVGGFQSSQTALDSLISNRSPADLEYLPESNGSGDSTCSGGNTSSNSDTMLDLSDSNNSVSNNNINGGNSSSDTLGVNVNATKNNKRKHTALTANHHSCSSTHEKDDKMHRMSSIVQSFRDVTNSLPLLNNKVRVVVEGVLCMYTDENLCITQIVMESVDKHNLKEINGIQ